MSHEPGDAAVRMLGLVLRHFRNRAGRSLRELSELALYDATPPEHSYNRALAALTDALRAEDLPGAGGSHGARRQGSSP